MAWEGSKKDEEQDKRLAKKHGMSMSKWEKSSMDKKHDTQKSAKGLKFGGKIPKSSGVKSMNPMNIGKVDVPKMGSDGAPPMPRYNARALRPGGMAKGGAVRGDGCASSGKTKGRMV